MPRCSVEEAAWPSGLRRQLQALVRKGASSNLAAVTFETYVLYLSSFLKFLNRLVERKQELRVGFQIK